VSSVGRAGVSGDREKRLPPNVVSMSLGRARIERSMRPGAGGKTKRAGCSDAHQLSLEHLAGCLRAERKLGCAAEARWGAGMGAELCTRGPRAREGGAQVWRACGVHKRGRKRRHKAQGGTTEPRSSSKWHCPALCLPTSCGCVPAIRSRGRQIWCTWQRPQVGEEAEAQGMRQHHRAKIELQMVPPGLAPANFLGVHASTEVCSQRPWNAVPKAQGRLCLQAAWGMQG